MAPDSFQPFWFFELFVRKQGRIGIDTASARQFLARRRPGFHDVFGRTPSDSIGLVGGLYFSYYRGFPVCGDGPNKGGTGKTTTTASPCTRGWTLAAEAE